MAQWMVRTDGSDPIGPVTTELLLRGIAQGRVPVESEVQALGSAEWQILEFVDVFADAIQSDDAMTKLAESPLDDGDILAYADAEEAFTRLAIPSGARANAAPPPPSLTTPRAKRPPPPPTSVRHNPPPPPPPAAPAYQEDDDAATRVASSPFSVESSQPPSAPALSTPGLVAGTWPAAPQPPHSSAPPHASAPPLASALPHASTPPLASALPQPPHAALLPAEQLTQQPPAVQHGPQPQLQPPPAPRARSGGASTALLALVVVLLAGCLGVLLWLLASR